MTFFIHFCYILLHFDILYCIIVLSCIFLFYVFIFLAGMNYVKGHFLEKASPKESQPEQENRAQTPH